MKRLIRRLSKVADSSQYHPLLPAAPAKAAAGIFGRGGRWGRSRRVPEGHVPVCVGEEMERFSVRADFLGRPAFVELLRWSAQEYGYDHAGVLRIPCPVPLFRRLLLLEFTGDVDDDTGNEPEELFCSISGAIPPSPAPS